MSTGFMGKKVNFFLFLMLLLILLGFGGVSVYYQYTLKNVNIKFDDATTTLATCEQVRDQTKDALNTAQRNLNSTETDIRKYDVLYEQKAGELETTEEQLTSTKTNLIRITIQSEVWKKERDNFFSEIKSLNKTIEDIRDEVDYLQDLVDDKNRVISCMANTDDSDEMEQCVYG